MPLKKAGKRAARSFAARYGKRGREVMFRTAVKNPKFARAIEPKGSRVRKAAERRARRMRGRRRTRKSPR